MHAPCMRAHGPRDGLSCFTGHGRALLLETWNLEPGRAAGLLRVPSGHLQNGRMMPPCLTPVGLGLMEGHAETRTRASHYRSYRRRLRMKCILGNRALTGLHESGLVQSTLVSGHEVSRHPPRKASQEKVVPGGAPPGGRMKAQPSSSIASSQEEEMISSFSDKSV